MKVTPPPTSNTSDSDSAVCAICPWTVQGTGTMRAAAEHSRNKQHLVHLRRPEWSNS